MAEAASPAARTPAECAALLQRHLPFLLYDALEVYFADDAAEWTRAPTNELHRHDGTVLTVSEGLSLDELGPTYRDGVGAEPSDYIAAVLPQLGRPPEPGAEHRPVVYVGRGSHASLFEPGYHQSPLHSPRHCRQPPKTTPRLVDVTDPPAWMLWPGHW